MADMKPITEGHFGLLLTGQKGTTFPQCKFPRVKEEDPMLFLLLSRRKSNPPRFNIYGGGRKNEMSGLQVLNKEMGEEAPGAQYEIVGSVGNPLYAELPAKRDYAFPYLLLHTGGEPPQETEESTDYVRLSSEMRFAKGVMADMGTSGDKCNGWQRWYGDLPYVKGTKPELARTEKMIWYGLSLCQIPAFYSTTDDAVPSRLPATLFDLSLKLKNPSERIYFADDKLMMLTTTFIAMWDMVDPQPLLDARSHE